MRIIAISDTHNFCDSLKIPPGDVLIHAGDATGHGTKPELIRFNSWLAALPHKHKFFVPGNHDLLFESDEATARSLVSATTILLDSSVVINGVKFYGSPWQPQFCDWAFNLPRGAALADKWSMIPEDTEVLITHSPPFGRKDRNLSGVNLGCDDLLKVVNRINPKLHIFGHIHEDYGISRGTDTVFVNASICNRDYIPANLPVILELEGSCYWRKIHQNDRA